VREQGSNHHPHHQKGIVMPTLTLDGLIEQRRGELNALTERIQAARARQTGIVNTVRSEGRRDLTPIETTEFEQLRTQIADDEQRHRSATTDLAELERAGAEEHRSTEAANDVTATDAGARDQAQQARSAEQTQTAGGYDRQARVGQEPRTYTRQTNREGRSIFVDMYRSNYMTDLSARERLERHMTEVRVEGEMSQRAASTSSFAGLVPPQYLVDQAAAVMRAGRPTANSVQRLPLPAEGMSLVIPRGTTGTSTAIQAAENQTVSTTDMAWTNLTVPVVTIAGYEDMSRQSLERGSAGMDELIFADLTADYAVRLNLQVLSGTGSSGQTLGILNTSGISQATAFSAAVTVPTMYAKMAGQVNAVETGRFMAPTLIVMHPRRWNFLIAQLDTTNRPLAVPNVNSPMNALAGNVDNTIDTTAATPVGSMFGLPVITDASIPTAVGTGPEDQIIICRREDLLLWEDGDGVPRELRFEQPLGNSLGIRLVAYGYSAFTAARYPAAVGVVGGNSASGFGLVAPSF
jgi:HK97 family phage major capsid protein